MLGLIIVGVIILAVLFITIVICNNKFQLAIIKIEEAENNIDMFLQKKSELLNRCIPIVKKELKTKEFLEDLNSFRDINLFELNNLLKRCSNEIFKVVDENSKLLKKEAMELIIEEINNNEIDLVAAIKYYNDAVVVFNQLISSFPSKIIAIFKRYKKKEFYNNEKKAIYDILNDK